MLKIKDENIDKNENFILLNIKNYSHKILFNTNKKWKFIFVKYDNIGNSFFLYILE